MIQHDMATAFRAISTIADVAALKLADKLRAVRDADVFFFPQRERAYRRG